MNVQDLNTEKPESQDKYRSLLLLDEIAKGEPLSQRDLSKKLNIALGLVNSYIKNLVAKGYVTIRSIPSKRYAYYLTPTGFTEKTRLTYQLLQDYTNIYRHARRDFKILFSHLSKQGISNIAFAGVDEVTEIAYLSLQEVDILLAGVHDDDKAGKDFFRMQVKPVCEIREADCEAFVITTFLKRDELYKSLIRNSVPAGKIHSIYHVPGDVLPGGDVG